MSIELLKVYGSDVLSSDLEIFYFPGGEPHCRKIENETSDMPGVEVAIVRRPTMEDLFALVAWSNINQTPKILAMPYLPAARADRDNPLMAMQMAEFIDCMVFPDELICLDPHSDKWLHEYMSPYSIISLTSVIDKVLKHKYDGVISPDKGAVYRATTVADHLKLGTFRAEKTRDFATGKLSGFTLYDTLPNDVGRYLLVDDICDGGGTFNGLADVIKTEYPNVTLDLYISHGIFSKGAEELLKRFDHIYTTDSWCKVDFITEREMVDPKRITVLPLKELILEIITNG